MTLFDQMNAIRADCEVLQEKDAVLDDAGVNLCLNTPFSEYCGRMECHVYSGIEALAEEAGQYLTLKSRDDSAYPFLKYFDHDGIRYYQLVLTDDMG